MPRRPASAGQRYGAAEPGGEPNFTVDTLARLHQERPEARIFAIAGADSFLTLRQWRDPERLLALAEWIVVSRPGFSLDDLAPLGLTPAQLARVHRLESLDEEISATDLRERLRLGIGCGTMLTPPVTLYIARQHLYHAGQPDAEAGSG